MIKASKILTKEELCLMESPPDPCAIVVFGALGDLVARKLLPSIFHLQATGALPRGYRVVGVGRTVLTEEQFRENVRKDLGTCGNSAQVEEFLGRLSYFGGDVSSPAFYKDLQKALDLLAAENGLKGRLFYLATPPSAGPLIIEQLRLAGLSRPTGAAGASWVRVVIEKPFGGDLASARLLNSMVHASFGEEQVYRIDHYLGKETVQNILMFRFANTLFEPAWNRAHIDHIQITSSETLGVERRAGYYDRAGVVRDMFQNHLMPLMCLIAMEPPTRFDADAVRDRRLDVMKAVRPFSEHDLDKNFVFGQYAGGVIEGGPVPAYRGEPGVPPESLTPTYAAIKLCVDNWCWQGVPFYLRSGKRLKERVTEIAVYFKQVPVSIFQPLPAEQLSGNILKFRVQPEEGISINFEAKHPGPKLCISTVTMDFDYRETFGTPPPEAYDRLLLDAMAGDQTIFARADEVEEAWSIFDPAVRYAEAGKPPEFYPAGGRGPEASDAMLARDGRTWDF